MKHLTILTLLLTSICFLACDDVSLITREAIQDVGSCFESAETTDDLYIVSLDRNCVDMELSVPPPVPTDPTAQPTVIERDWELIATLERDLYQKDWHKFHVYDHDEQNILTAFREGKDLLFAIGAADGQSISPIQEYFIQTEPPTIEKRLFYPYSNEKWFTHWGPENATTHRVPVDRSNPGLSIILDPGFPGSEFHHPDNKKKKWVGGDVEFRTKLIPEKKTDWDWAAVRQYSPHIKEGIVLKIYAR